MPRSPTGDKPYCGGNSGSGRFGSFQSHWKCSLILEIIIMAIVCFDVGWGHVLSRDTTPVPVIASTTVATSLPLTTSLPVTTSLPDESSLPITTSIPSIDLRTRNKGMNKSVSQINEEEMKKNTTCTSNQCRYVENNFRKSSMSRVDPCEDFYQYACGSWGLSNEHNLLYMLQQKINDQVIRFLNASNQASDPKPVKQARDLFRSCMDTGGSEEQYSAIIINFLRSVGLPPFPTYGLQNVNETSNFDWFNTAYNIKIQTGLDVIIGFKISPVNSSMDELHIGLPSKFELFHDLDWYDNYRERQIISSRETGYAPHSTTDQEDFKSLLEKYVNASSNDTLKYDYSLTVDKFYQTRLEIENVRKQPRNQTVYSIYRNGFPFHHYYQFHSDIKEYAMNHSPSVLELYMWMTVVREFEIYRQNMLKQSEESKLEKCIEVQKIFGLAIAYGIADPDFHNLTKPKIETMIDDIKVSLADLISQAEWMNNETKLLSYEKIKQMKALIGYPEWLFDEGKLEEYYDGIEIDSTKHMIENMINIHRVQYGKSVKTLPRVDQHIKVPAEVNAYYKPFRNSISVPMAISQNPFYDLGLDSLNYGALGSVVGHEISHGFDNDGINYDKDGNYHLWDKETIDNYTKRSSCFEDQYSNTYIGNSTNNVSVNGTITLGENIADNVGLRAAFAALKRRLIHERELRLPGFEWLSSEQLFFLSFANIGCSNETIESLRWQVGHDEHSPSQARVLNVLKNNEDFAKAWGCKPGSTMNPHNKCTLF